MANLPAACRRCAAGDWPYAPNGGVERCDCLRGRQLLYIAECRGRRRDDVPGVTEVQAALAIEELAVMMPFVPDGDIAHALLARELMRFVCDAEELAWLVRQLVLRYAKWPGMREARALYCAAFSPMDGQIVETAVYDDGIIPGVCEPPHLLADSPRGGRISRDPREAGLIRALGDAKRLNAPEALPLPDPPSEEEERIWEQKRLELDRLREERMREDEARKSRIRAEIERLTKGGAA